MEDIYEGEGEGVGGVVGPRRIARKWTPAPGFGPDTRFLPEDQTRKFEVRQLWELHEEILRRLVLGEKPNIIAAELDITPQTVSNIRNSRLGRERIADLKGERDCDVKALGERVTRLTPLALDVLENVLNGDEEASVAMRIKVALSVTSSAGFGPTKRIAIAHGHYTPQELEAIKAKALDVGREAGVVIPEYREITDDVIEEESL